MLPLPKVFTPDALTVQVFNALLRREPWAAERLGRHAGKSLRFDIGGLRVGYTIEAAGRLGPCDPAVVPDVTLTIDARHLASLPGILRSGDLAAITEKLHVQGDAGLATLVSELARDLRWDIEEDVASVFGDVLGPRIVSALRAAAGFAQSAAGRLTQNVAEYVGEESRMLTTRPAMDSFRRDVAAMLQRLEALERRVAGRAGGGH